MSGDRLGDALRSLPEPELPSGLTDRVMARLPPGPPRPPRKRPLVLAAVLVAAGVAGSLVMRPSPSPRRDRVAQRLDALKSEHEELRREIGEIQRLRADMVPVVYVGGAEQVDYFVELVPRAGSSIEAPQHGSGGRMP